MNNHNQTDADLAYWIEKYLIFRVSWSFTSLVNAGGGGSSKILTASASQDLFGWTEFLYGKVSKEIRRIQEVHCTLSPCRITGTDWMKLLVAHLIHIFYSQWILRNFTLHNKQCRYLRLQQHRDLLREVNPLLDTPSEEVPEGSWYLLELEFSTLYNATFERQSSWVLAVKEARRAGRRIAQTVKHQQNSKKHCTAAQLKPIRLKYDFTCNERQMRYELGLNPAPRRRPCQDPDGTENPSNKRMQKPI
jgi:hypothetical protein